MVARTRTVEMVSSPMMNIPSILRFAIAQYAFPNQRKALRRIFTEGFQGLTDRTVHRLLKGEIKYTVEGGSIIFTP